MGHLLRKMVQYLDKKFPNYVLMGNKAYQTGKYEEAIEHYQKVEATKRYNEYVCYNWGRALAALNRLEDAIIKFKEALEINDKLGDSYVQWGVCLYRIGNFLEADTIFETAKEKFPENASIYFHQAMNKEPQNLMDEAIELYLKAMELNPKDVMSPNAIGKIYYHQDKYDVAYQYFEKAVSNSPRFAPAILSLAYLENMRGNEEKAKGLLKLANNIDPLSLYKARESGKMENILKNYF